MYLSYPYEGPNIKKKLSVAHLHIYAHFENGRLHTSSKKLTIKIFINN